ncbi:hypothetical protein B0H16DRAFT_1741356 [Mycena metata]|uniref:RING-type domain-containing protein n=1 Tax=Mycena metata TaxID=1033252 RepID=A0AAD7HAV8_9AGAR|nr:hypothetical protein B0H16DRAFT_1741356 [Mycena metata]
MSGRSRHGRRPPLGTADNLILMDENGNFVKSFRRLPQINRGPPSIINTVPFWSDPTSPTPARRGSRYIQVVTEEDVIASTLARARARIASSTASSSTASLLTAYSFSSLSTTISSATTVSSSTTLSSRPAREQRPPLVPLRRAAAPEPLSLARTRVRPWSVTILRHTGSCAPLPENWGEDNLYIGTARPPASPDIHTHECGICLNIQSHPVILQCKHSYCYVCIRQWLQQSWQCPGCCQPQTDRPRQNGDKAAAIATDYPPWVDTSSVTYSWEGLKFPKPSFGVQAYSP